MRVCVCVCVHAAVVLPPQDQRLVIILSNCHYLRTQVVLRIFDCFRTHGYPQAKKTEEVCLKCTYVHTCMRTYVMCVDMCM